MLSVLAQRLKHILRKQKQKIGTAYVKKSHSLREEIAQSGLKHLHIFPTLQYSCHHFHIQPIGSEVDSLALCFTTSDQTLSLL